MNKYILLVGLAMLSQVSIAQVGYSSAGEKVAFDGFDLVSYFKGEPVQGNKGFSVDHQGLKLVFDSQANKNTFLKNPEKYLPAYGGWCATAMVVGNAVRPDFTKYKVQNGKLMFFEVKAFFNGQTQWEKDPDKHEILADLKFKEVQTP